MTPSAEGVLAKTARGAGWVIGWRMATRALGMVSTLILARLLVPADFGLVALGTSFSQAVDILASLGVEEAIIRDPSPTQAVYDTGFTMNLLRSVGTAAVVAVLAFPAAGWFSEPRLTWILLALAVAMVLDGCANIGTIDFRKNFAFHKEFRYWIVPRVLSIIVVIVSAFVSRSYWALIAGIVFQRLVTMVFSYWMHPYRPRLSLGAWRQLVGYSLWTWALSVASLIGDRSDIILIGRFLNPTSVGIFGLGSEIAHLPTSELVLPLTRAAFSGFSAIRNTATSTADTYVRMVSAMALLTLPAGTGISLIADPVVKLAFGPLWTAATPLVQIIGLAGTLMVFGRIGFTVFQVYGRLDLMFRLTALSTAVRLVLLVLLLPRYGLIGGALAAGGGVIFDQIIYVIFVMWYFRIRLAALWRQTWRSLLATAAMATVLRATGLGWVETAGDNLTLATTLCSAILVGAATYTGALLFAWLASGRPDSVERDILRMAEQGWRNSRGC